MTQNGVILLVSVYFVFGFFSNVFLNSISGLVKQVADNEGRQFILTSFYRQTVEQGDKFYGVTNVNRVSVRYCSLTDHLLTILTSL